MIRHLVNRLLPELRSIAVEVQGLAADVRALRHEVTMHRAALERLLGCPPDRIPPEVQIDPACVVIGKPYQVGYHSERGVFWWGVPAEEYPHGESPTLHEAIAAGRAAYERLRAAQEPAPEPDTAPAVENAGYHPCALCGRDVDLGNAHCTTGDAPVHHDCKLDAKEEE